MKSNKIQPTKVSVTAYVKTLADSQAQKEAKVLIKLFKTVTGVAPVLWGNIVGFGSYHYKYQSGREGDYIATGFAMRKSGPTIYIIPGYEYYTQILAKLGPHKLGKSCLYLKNLNEVDLSVLQKLIKAGLRDLQKKYPVRLK